MLSKRPNSSTQWTGWWLLHISLLTNYITLFIGCALVALTFNVLLFQDIYQAILRTTIWGIKEAVSLFLIVRQRCLIFFLDISPIQKRNYCCPFQWSLPFISRWHFRSLSGIRFVCMLVPLEPSMPLHQLSASRRGWVLGSHAMDKSTISATAIHPADNFHVAAGEEFSKRFSSPLCSFSWGNARLLSWTFLTCHILFRLSFIPFECVSGIIWYLFP